MGISRTTVARGTSFGIDQNHKLVYGSEDDYGSEKVHQRLDKQTGHYGQYQTEQHAAYSYNRECRLARYNKRP